MHNYKCRGTSILCRVFVGKKKHPELGHMVPLQQAQQNHKCEEVYFHGERRRYVLWYIYYNISGPWEQALSAEDLGFLNNPIELTSIWTILATQLNFIPF